jgi:hypothetical protein
MPPAAAPDHETVNVRTLGVGGTIFFDFVVSCAWELRGVRLQPASPVPCDAQSRAIGGCSPDSHRATLAASCRGVQTREVSPCESSTT